MTGGRRQGDGFADTGTVLLSMGSGARMFPSILSKHRQKNRPRVYLEPERLLKEKGYIRLKK